MFKISVITLMMLTMFSPIVSSQDRTEGLKKLEFMAGEWESSAKNLKTGVTSSGSSSIQRIINGTWLQWKFTAELENGPLEVITLITYQADSKQYAFYSFNPMDNEPIPHFGKWIDSNTLILSSNFGGEKVNVKFTVLENGDFFQEHSRITPEGTWEITWKTHYFRKK